MKTWRSRYLFETLHQQMSVSTLLLYWGLCPLSFFYGLVMRLRAWLYAKGLKQSYRAAIPVVSVGNLVAGGTGKTPMVDFLAKYVRSLGIDCAIVSRGYGGDYAQPVGTVRDVAGRLCMTPRACGDEPYLLAMRNPDVPVYVARDRKLGVQSAERGGAQLIILDDGFQHLAVARDLDIVLLDHCHPFGNGRMIPSGLLREPLSALQRASLIVMTRSDGRTGAALPVQAPVLHSRHEPDRQLRDLAGQAVDSAQWAGKSCLAFAGIANPGDFFASLSDLGFRRIETVPLDDHQVYGPDVLNRLVRSCHNHDLLVTTEKDAVKLPADAFPVPCLQRGLNMVFDDFDALSRGVTGVLRTYTIVSRKNKQNEHVKKVL